MKLKTIKTELCDHLHVSGRLYSTCFDEKKKHSVKNCYVTVYLSLKIFCIPLEHFYHRICNVYGTKCLLLCSAYHRFID